MSRVAVIIASYERPQLLAQAVADLSEQTREFDLIVSVPDESSLPPDGLPYGQVVTGARGAASQRNAALDVAPDADYVFFFDDDSVVRADYLEKAVEFFEAHPRVVGLTGRVVLDGAQGDEITRESATRALEESLGEVDAAEWTDTRELYGCNFAFRPPLAGGERFDGRLPLYSWLEDHDLARRLMRHGTLAKVPACVIVHRGVKSGGRVAHARLGYSQMMNPLYLHHVGSFPAWLAFREIVFRCGKNLVYSVAGSQAAWRRERVRGNAAALADALRGRFTPERMLDF